MTNEHNMDILTSSICRELDGKISRHMPNLGSYVDKIDIHDKDLIDLLSWKKQLTNDRASVVLESEIKTIKFNNTILQNEFKNFRMLYSDKKLE